MQRIYSGAQSGQGFKELHTCICTDIVHNLIGKGKMTHIIYTLCLLSVEAASTPKTKSS